MTVKTGAHGIVSWELSDTSDLSVLSAAMAASIEAALSLPQGTGTMGTSQAGQGGFYYGIVMSPRLKYGMKAVSYGYQVPTDGTYELRASCNYAPTTSTISGDVRVMLNASGSNATTGTNLLRGFVTTTPDAAQSVSLSRRVDLSAQDIVQFFMQVKAGQTLLNGAIFECARVL